MIISIFKTKRMINNPILWQPSFERISRANITRFIEWLRERNRGDFSDYAALYRWSCEEKEKFWMAVWEFSELISHKPYRTIYKPGKEFFSGKWFDGMELNFAENLLRYRDDQTAIIFSGEDGRSAEISYQTLYRRVAEVAAGLKAVGVTVGDRVVGVMPNVPETIIAMLATTSLGAIWASCSPDFGEHALQDRVMQLHPKIIFTTDGYQFKGESFSIIKKISELQEKVSASHVIIFPYLHDYPDINTIQKAKYWNDFILPEKEIDFVSLPFDHPVYILFSSGTTGIPKCIEHTAGGTLIQHIKELALHTDIKRDDRFCFYTTCGWMMWNWMVSGLALGATLVLYEGSPIYPHADALLAMIEKYEISVFGASAAYFAELAHEKISPKQHYAFKSLKTILSTGSPLLPEQFDYIYQQIKADVCVSSISGGTDIISCFVVGNPILPVRRGECQCRGLGMAVEIYDAEGHAILNTPGELVCTRPFPSMPLGFWHDKDQSKYKTAYFSHFPNVWCHGDYALLTELGGVVMLGRSDAVLKPSGVRIGTAEIYRPLSEIPEIAEAIVVGQLFHDLERIVLFVKLKPGYFLNDDLQEKIKEKIKTEASARHVPAKILQVIDIPRTLNGKLAEVAVKNCINNQQINNENALANPQSLQYFRNRPELLH